MNKNRCLNDELERNLKSLSNSKSKKMINIYIIKEISESFFIFVFNQLCFKFIWNTTMFRKISLGSGTFETK
jgi:hypothetical protein